MNVMQVLFLKLFRLDIVEIKHDNTQWLQLNIYRAVRQWRLSHGDLHRHNFGLMIMMRNDGNKNIGMARIASSLHENLTIRPRLLICVSSGSW